MTDEPKRKFYAATGEARLITCEDEPFGAALELVARLLDGRASGLFSRLIFVSEAGYRDERFFTSTDHVFSTWECLVLLGRIPNCTSEQFSDFLSNLGGHNANQDDDQDSE
jgi:hypothetical protein